MFPILAQMVSPNILALVHLFGKYMHPSVPPRSQVRGLIHGRVDM